MFLTLWPLGNVGVILKNVSFKITVQIYIMGIFCQIALIWLPQNTFDYKSILVQVMAWCWQHQAITWANVDIDLCRHMTPSGQNELTLGMVSLNYFEEICYYLFTFYNIHALHLSGTDSWNSSLWKTMKATYLNLFNSMAADDLVITWTLMSKVWERPLKAV